MHHTPLQTTLMVSIPTGVNSRQNQHPRPSFAPLAWGQHNKTLTQQNTKYLKLNLHHFLLYQSKHCSQLPKDKMTLVNDRITCVKTNLHRTNILNQLFTVCYSKPNFSILCMNIGTLQTSDPDSHLLSVHSKQEYQRYITDTRDLTILKA